MWVRFTEVFRWSPPEAKRAWSQVIQPSIQNVTRACAEAAIAAGKAEPATRPRKGKKAEE
jgi:hypothetical protein